MDASSRFEFDPHYMAVKEFYSARTAERSGIPYMNHIDEGLLILDAIDGSLDAKQAYCLHPIVQGDDEFAVAFHPKSVLNKYEIGAYPLALAIEYRSVANEYRSHRRIASTNEIRLSPLAEVNDMLIADKVQNRKDFLLYHNSTHPDSRALKRYFSNWLSRLEISEERYSQLVKTIAKHS